MPATAAPKTVQTISTNPTEFQGYPVNLLRGLRGMGRAIIGDDKLWAAADAFNTIASSGSSTLGPALLTADATQRIQSNSTIPVPDTVNVPDPTPAPADPATAEAAAWDKYELEDLIALALKHHVELGRVKTHGKVQAALIAAGVKPQ